VDLIAYAAQEAAQMGAHVIKVKPPKDQVALPRGEAGVREVRHPDQDASPTASGHVVQSTFNGKRIIIFSGGEAKDTPAVLDGDPRHPRRRRLRLDHGRNSFQRPKDEALKLLRDVMGIYQGK
jgi:class I fructose-bisphosphate aldolase